MWDEKAKRPYWRELRADLAKQKRVPDLGQEIRTNVKIPTCPKYYRKVQSCWICGNRLLFNIKQAFAASGSQTFLSSFIQRFKNTTKLNPFPISSLFTLYYWVELPYLRIHWDRISLCFLKYYTKSKSKNISNKNS